MSQDENEKRKAKMLAFRRAGYSASESVSKLEKELVDSGMSPKQVIAELRAHMLATQQVIADLAGPAVRVVSERPNR